MVAKQGAKGSCELHRNTPWFACKNKIFNPQSIISGKNKFYF